MPERIVVVGVVGDGGHLDESARSALLGAQLVLGGRRQLEAVGVDKDRSFVIGRDIAAALDAIEKVSKVACVVASGDPGFFGIVRPLSERFGADVLEVHPAPSSVALAFTRIGMSWDDAAVVSAHGRRLDAAVSAAARAPKVAVLVSPDNPPEALGKALVALGVTRRKVHVCSQLGTSRESVVHTDMAGLAGGTWDPVSVVILIAQSPSGSGASLAWGLPDEAFEHRGGMLTKSEVRAVALGKLDLPALGVMWDVGAGSASVSIEACRLAPRLEVHAVERDREQVARARHNALAHDVVLRLVEGEAPAVLEALPDPDRVFVGGGGLGVVEEVLRRLRPGGRVVATFAALERATEACSRLGNLVQISAARGARLPDGGLRLEAQNPVFVVWGPS